MNCTCPRCLRKKWVVFCLPFAPLHTSFSPLATHLPLAQLPSPAVVRPVQRRRAVDYDQGVPVLGHDGRSHLEELHLVLGVVGAGVRHVLEGHLGVHAEPGRGKDGANGRPRVRECDRRGGLAMADGGFAGKGMDSQGSIGDGASWRPMFAPLCSSRKSAEGTGNRLAHDSQDS